MREGFVALITCADCGKAFSDAATACPGCGRPNAVAEKKAPASNGCLIVILILVALLGSLFVVLSMTLDSEKIMEKAKP